MPVCYKLVAMGTRLANRIHAFWDELADLDAAQVDGNETLATKLQREMQWPMRLVTVERTEPISTAASRSEP